jgi:hypothetical protein
VVSKNTKVSILWGVWLYLKVKFYIP